VGETLLFDLAVPEKTTEKHPTLSWFLKIGRTDLSPVSTTMLPMGGVGSAMA
jgi:hypothetical protein